MGAPFPLLPNPACSGEAWHRDRSPSVDPSWVPALGGGPLAGPGSLPGRRVPEGWRQPGLPPNAGPDGGAEKPGSRLWAPVFRAVIARRVEVERRQSNPVRWQRLLLFWNLGKADFQDWMFPYYLSLLHNCIFFLISAFASYPVAKGCGFNS